jgi:hypothetical protein
MKPFTSTLWLHKTAQSSPLATGVKGGLLAEPLKARPKGSRKMGTQDRA